MFLEAELIMELTVEIAPMQEVGYTREGFLRVIPITGGIVSGPNIKGKVIPGGADWNTILDEERNHVWAKYTIQTDDGYFVSIDNEGYTDNTRSNVTIRTSPKFEVDKSSKYAGLLSGVFVASLQKSSVVASAMDIKMYKMK